jgi:hypothetical protein
VDTFLPHPKLHQAGEKQMKLQRLPAQRIDPLLLAILTISQKMFHFKGGDCLTCIQSIFHAGGQRSLSFQPLSVRAIPTRMGLP